MATPAVSGLGAEFVSGPIIRDVDLRSKPDNGVRNSKKIALQT